MIEQAAPVPARRAAARVVVGLAALLALTPAAHAEDPPDDLPIVEGPRMVTYVDAPYPEAAKAAGLEGEVVLYVELDETGAVMSVEVATAAGHGFDEAAVAAVQQMKFTPARTSAGPVGVVFPFTYRFDLPDAPAAPEAPSAAAGKDRGGPPPADVPPEELPILEGPKIEAYVEAPYPAEAQAAGLEATVTLQVTLSDAGVVEDAVVVNPAGHGFDEAAVQAVKAMRFTPARTAAGPVGVVFEFAYSFQLTPEAPVEARPEPVNVEGHVRRMGGGREVAGVGVELTLADGTVLQSTTDETGAFSFRGVPVGPHQLELRHPEYVQEKETIEVAAGEVTRAEVWLRALTYRENEAVGFYEKERTEVTRHTLSIEEVKRIPGTFGDPVKVIQTLPGAARSPFGTGLLIIRGANPQDTAVYVDGVRIPIVYHLTGFTSVLSPEIVKSVDYLPGGYGVQYGRAMAGTVDVTTKEKFGTEDGRPKIVAGLDLLDAQVWFEGNVGKKDGKKHGLALGVRRSYVDLFIPVFTAGSQFQVKPYYWDYQLKWAPPTGPKDKVSAFVFGFQDILRVSTPPDQARGSDPDTQGDIRTSYQAHRIIVRWQHEFSDKLKLDLRPSVGADVNNLGLGNAFGLDSWDVLGMLRGELSYTPHPAVEILPGVDFIGGPYDFAFKSPLSVTDLDDPLAERDPVGFTGKGTAWYTAPYLKLNFRPLADRERWLITPGLRYDTTVYVVGGTITFGEDVANTVIQAWDPRIATRFVAYQKGDMSLTLKGSTGLYSQPPQPYESIGIGTTAKINANQAWNSEIGLEHKIDQALSWSAVGFYREMYDLVVFNNGFTGRGTQPFTNLGDGRAYGFEVILRHAPVGRFFGWVSYTFSRSFRRDTPDGNWYRFNYDQPHILSAQGGYNFPHDIGVSAQVQVVSGNPYTPLNAGVYDVDGDFYNGFALGPYNSQRMPTFVQTSFRVDKTWTFKKWQFELYLDLINAIRGVNPEITTYNYDYSQYAFVRGLPFLPNLGLEFKVLP